MKFQFSVKAILLATTAVAISCGGVIAWSKVLELGDLGWALKVAAVAIPYWLPFAFAAFAIGSKSLTVRMILVFAIAEAAGVGITYILITYFN